MREFESASFYRSQWDKGTGLGKGDLLGFFVFVCLLGGGFGFLVGFFVVVVVLVLFFVKPWYFVLVFLQLYLNLKLLGVCDSVVCYILKQKVLIMKLVVSAILDD